jgi:hypothetical protein
MLGRPLGLISASNDLPFPRRRNPWRGVRCVLPDAFVVGGV